ncbi:DUF4189 domain-containing protein [Xanthomonas sacchari]|uniref:DUF4189 domain-containing protein n=1 Tax=Xanthomonas sacchari TaxID=56458 RepID=UPI001FC92997|nr:DUF4189 domain-containing protein [Xanthomonas sacchari]
MLKIFIQAFLMVFFCFNASAQTRCPVGVKMGSAQCLPDDNEAAPPRPTGEWIKTWGAIAAASNGDIGSSTGKFSEQDAKDNALRICENFGNSDCKIMVTYKNQCVAVVKAADGRIGGKIVTAGGEDEARKDALNQCKKTSGAECSVVGTDCSKPYFKKY